MMSIVMLIFFNKEGHMLTLEQIRDRLRDRNLKRVAQATGLVYMTLVRIASGETPDPRYKKLKILSDYLESKNG